MERKMETYQSVSFLARSLAGHDRGRVYAVIGEDEAGYVLADGIHATLLKTKYKKKIHVQVIRKLTPEIIETLNAASSDEELSKAIKMYEYRILS